MYHAKTTESQKKVLIDSFSALNGNCWVLFSTIAFGMEINIANMQRMVHHGILKNLFKKVAEEAVMENSVMQCSMFILDALEAMLAMR